MSQFKNLTKFASTGMLTALILSSLSSFIYTDEALAKKGGKGKSDDSATTTEAAGCSNNGHGNNASVTYDWDGGKLTIGHYDPSNPSGKQTDSLIESLDDGIVGRAGNGSNAPVISWSHPSDNSYRMTKSEARDLVNNHPDWELKGNGIYECPGNDFDGDGVNDAVEIGSNVNSPLDTDGDGTPDYADADSNPSSSGSSGSSSSSSNNYDYSRGDFPFFRASEDPTDFHSVTDDEGNVGVEVFQQFANTERNRLDLSDLQARELDVDKLVISEDIEDVKVYFINEGAGYRNQLKVSTTGTTQIAGMIFNDVSCHSSESLCQYPWGGPPESQSLKLGDYVNLGNLAAGTTLDFQVVQNGFNNPNNPTWYTDKTRNSDGLQHVIAYSYEGYLILGWEDITGGGDNDYNDVVFAVYIGEDNLDDIPSSPETNQPPVANDDVVSTPFGSPITISVLDNDTDPEEQSLSVYDADDLLSDGSVSIQGNEIIYTPASGFSGSDFFTYTISDNQGLTDSASVNVTVEPEPELSCAIGSSISLTGTIRDFSDTHPDFQYRTGNDRNMVTTEIGSDRKPVYGNHPNGTHTTNGKQYFDQWYRDVDGVNQSMPYTIELTRQSNGNFRYQNTNFFPINDQMMGNEGRDKNFHFTYELQSQFYYDGTEKVLNFSGDDDVWVYINGKRVIDLGGVHARQNANVTIDEAKAEELGLEAGNFYDFDFFFAERHTTQSNFILETSLELLCDYDNDGIVDAVEGTEDTDGDGIPNYQDEDSDGNGILDSEEGAGDTDGDGVADFLDEDNDGNGFNDYEDSTGDADGDGILDYQDTDMDNDGINDNQDPDMDGDGISNSEENNPNNGSFPFNFVFPEGGSPDDIDGDGILNSVDSDSDGNGIPDISENTGDYNQDGTPDHPSFDDDIDDDGIPNSLDTNDDDDDLTDVEEYNYNAGNPLSDPAPEDPDPGVFEFVVTIDPSGDEPTNDPTNPRNPGIPDIYHD